MAAATELQALPDVASLGGDIPQSLRNFLAAVALFINTREGRWKNSDPKDKLVTFRDLEGEAVGKVISANKSVAVAATSGGSSGVVIANPGSSGVDTVDLSIPPGLSNVVVETSMVGVMATFDQPSYNKSGTDYSNHAYTMLYMADANADGSSPGFAAAKPTGQSAGPVIYVPIGASRTVYVWLRNISKADVKGPLSGGAEGYRAVTPISPKVYIDLLNGATFDGLTIRNNGFRICSPDGTKQVTPFAVLTQDTMMGGTLVPAGVYMDGAHIVNLDASMARLGNAVIDESKIGILKVSKLDASTMNAAFANAVVGQFQDLSALRTKTGSLTVDKWLTISGNPSGWSGITTPGYGFSGQANNGLAGFLFARDPSPGWMFQMGDDTAKIWMSHWGDCGIKFPNFTVDKNGNAWFGGTLKTGIVGTNAIAAGALSSIQYGTGGDSLYIWVSVPDWSCKVLLTCMGSGSCVALRRNGTLLKSKFLGQAYNSDSGYWDDIQGEINFTIADQPGPGTHQYDISRLDAGQNWRILHSCAMTTLLLTR